MELDSELAAVWGQVLAAASDSELAAVWGQVLAEASDLGLVVPSDLQLWAKAPASGAEMALTSVLRSGAASAG